MKLNRIVAPLIGLAIAASPVFAGAASALTASCVGVPSTSSITWTASSSGGVAPIAYLWGNSSTSPAQTVSAVPGVYSITLQATDASSTVATTTCGATVAQPAPTIVSFIATPSVITVGQSSVLSWSVTNASSTSINNGVGTVTGSSITVTPGATTVYQLSAVNPNGTVTSNATVTVNATSTGDTTQARIQALLKMIADLRAQIALIMSQQSGGNNGGQGTTTPPTVGQGGCNVFTRNLSQGDDGDDVKQLQQNLSQDPSILPPGLVTGHFGKKTAEALMKYQQKHGIASTTTGFFGPKSRDFLNKHCGDDNRGIHPMPPVNVNQGQDGGNHGGERGGNGGGRDN